MSESEDISDVKKLALQINKIGSAIADISVDYRDNLSDLEERIELAEDDFELLVERLMEAPPGAINTQSLNIVGKVPSYPPQQASPTMASPTTPNLKAPTTASSPTPPSTGSTPSGGPNLNTAPPQPGGAPNMKSAPSDGGPNLNAAPPQPGGSPNLQSAPTGGPNLDAAPPQSGGGPNLSTSPGAGSIGDALKNLKKAPQQEPSQSSPPVPGGGGVTAGSIQDALKNLKKAPKQEKKAAPSGGGSPFGGFNPAEALKKLKKTPKKDEVEEDEGDDEEEHSEFASILQKRRQASDVDALGKETSDKPKEIKEPSAEEMKSQLQSKLKQAFKKSS